MTLGAYKFSNTALETQPNILKLNGNDISPEEFLKLKYGGGIAFGIDNLLKSGVYRIHGWKFDFRPYLHRYVYCQYGTWTEAWAPNKTALRKVIIGKIDEIIEAINKNQKEE